MRVNFRESLTVGGVFSAVIVRVLVLDRHMSEQDYSLEIRAGSGRTIGETFADSQAPDTRSRSRERRA